MRILRSVTKKRYFPGQAARKFSARDGKSAHESALHQFLFQSRTPETDRQDALFALIAGAVLVLPTFVIIVFGLVWVPV